MVVAIAAFVLLIIDLFFAVTQQAIECEDTFVCSIDSSQTFFQATIWLLGILVVIFVVISRVMLLLFNYMKILKKIE